MNWITDFHSLPELLDQHDGTFKSQPVLCEVQDGFLVLELVQYGSGYETRWIEPWSGNEFDKIIRWCKIEQ